MTSAALPRLVAVEGGRLVMRRTGGGLVFVGVLHLPDAVRPDPRSAAQPWMCSISMTGREPVLMIWDRPGPAVQIDGIDPRQLFDFARAPAWRRHHAAGHVAFDARLVPAFEGGCWTMLAVAPQVAVVETGAVHQWFDLGPAGRLQKVPSPTDAPQEGMALRQLARDLCVWPDRQGVLRTLPTVTADAAQEIAFANLYRVLVEQGHLDQAGQDLLLRNVPQLESALRQAGRADRDYLQYLGAVACAGLLQPERAFTEGEKRQQQDAAGRITRAIVVESRRRELAGLADALMATGAAVQEDTPAAAPIPGGG